MGKLIALFRKFFNREVLTNVVRVKTPEAHAQYLGVGGASQVYYPEKEGDATK